MPEEPKGYGLTTLTLHAEGAAASTAFLHARELLKVLSRRRYGSRFKGRYSTATSLQLAANISMKLSLRLDSGVIPRHVPYASIIVVFPMRQ